MNLSPPIFSSECPSEEGLAAVVVMDLLGELLVEGVEEVSSPPTINEPPLSVKLFAKLRPWALPKSISWWYE